MFRTVSPRLETPDGLMTMSLALRYIRSALCLRTLAPLATAVWVAGAMFGCRSAPQAADARGAGPRCDPEAPGTLRIANSSGRILDVYVARPSGTPQLVAQVSPGTISLPVPGPTDLGVRYDVIDPNARTLLSTVNWNRRTGRETMVGVILELICKAVPGETIPGMSR